jgi:hypothetical protein
LSCSSSFSTCDVFCSRSGILDPEGLDGPDVGIVVDNDEMI